MAYIGNVPAEKYTALTQQTFSSPTGTSFTLSQAVTNSVDIDLYIDNVKQDPASYSVSGTSLTTSTIASPSTMYCIFNGKAMQTVNPPDGSVGTAKVADDAITLAKLAPGTDGNIISFDASGNPVAVATGSDGQVLTSTGAGSAPAFEALPAGGLLEYSRGALNGAVTINSTTPSDPGIRANLNPTSTGDIIRIHHFWSYADSTSGTAQKIELIKSLNGGSIASHIVWTDYMNHWIFGSSTVRSTSSLWWTGTANDLGWSTGVLALGVRVSLQNSNTWVYNEGFGLTANGSAKQMSYIEAFRYSASAYTAGTDA